MRFLDVVEMWNWRSRRLRWARIPDGRSCDRRSKRAQLVQCIYCASCCWSEFSDKQTKKRCNDLTWQRVLIIDRPKLSSHFGGGFELMVQPWQCRLSTVSADRNSVVIRSQGWLFCFVLLTFYVMIYLFFIFMDCYRDR